MFVPSFPIQPSAWSNVVFPVISILRVRRMPSDASATATKVEAAVDPLTQVDKAVMKMKVSKGVDIDAVKQLGALYHQATNEDMKKLLGDRLAKNQVGVVFKKYLTTIEKSSKDMILLRKVCWNYSHASQDLCEQLARAGLIPILLSELRRYIDSNEMGSDDVIGLLAITHNCAKVAANKKYFKGREAIGTILRFTRVQKETIRMVVILTLSYIVDEENNELITADDSVIENIVVHLKAALKRENHKSEGWTAYELVSGLKHLATNNENAVTIAKKEVVPTLLSLIQDGSDKEREIAGDTLWMLTFVEENKKTISQNENTMKILRDVSSKEGSAKQAALGILWVLDSGRRVAEKENEYDETRPHIMISYQWDNQDLMDRIYEELTNRGYNVWIDIHCMSGSILEAMSEAVEKAEIVIVGMSQKYKDSPNCRTEAEYAFNLRKTIIPLKVEEDYKADGWLGALVGTKLYINFSGMTSYHGPTFQKKITKLVNEIEETGITSVTQSLAVPEDKPVVDPEISDSSGSASPPAPRPEVAKPVPDSKEWMSKHQLTSPKLAALDMEELQFLRELKQKAPDVFYRFLCGDMNHAQLRELLNITNAMDDF